MPQGDYGDLTIGRLLLRETFKEGESSGTARTIDLEGQESNPPLTRAQLVWRHDNVTALEPGSVQPLTFTDKPERNCYVNVDSVSADYTEWRNDVVTSDWKLGLTRLGSDSEVDLQSRLTGVARVNDFSLTGERWHAPPIGHYGYQTGTSSPTTMTRTGADGAITVYRSIPSGASPRWGCAPTSYLNGRVRLASSGTEVCGVDQTLASTGWALANGLVNVTPGSSGTLDVQTYTGGAWCSKVWNVSVAGSGSSITSWDGATLLRNDCEHVILRLTKGLNPGRATLDLTLRRGSRTVEGYLQTTTSNTLAAYLATAETNTSFAASGYVTATNDDADGNKFACGSARTFTAHANGGLQKASTTSLDFWIGAEASQPTLNSNPSFETDTSGWGTTNATLTRSNVQAKVGSWSGLITSDPGGKPRAESQQAAATAGTSYRASGWLYAPQALPLGVEIVMYWFDAGHGFLAESIVFSTVPTVGAWVPCSGTATAPANTAFATVLFSMSGTPGAGLLLYGDDVRLRAATPSGDAATDLRNQYIGALPETIYAVRR
ncbi:hypothetical protein [Streptomyces sp. NBC_01373]|uniref:hypothetical protein n=1 Tax=Streptomyces sp. NBC_01373 TaxID=2903843 RepID=UPI002252B858|nr:hypothetical protein [Streptomyces sp. NBC_01373]MCX4704364.1 hypothetical protein [Streptomyces sp. NBC_01373]MCX4707104.1 hypothetical protein [Streptomyces sp. NBC_01373]